MLRNCETGTGLVVCAIGFVLGWHLNNSHRFADSRISVHETGHTATVKVQSALNMQSHSSIRERKKDLDMQNDTSREESMKDLHMWDHKLVHSLINERNNVHYVQRNKSTEEGQQDLQMQSHRSTKKGKKDHAAMGSKRQVAVQGDLGSGMHSSDPLSESVSKAGISYSMFVAIWVVTFVFLGSCCFLNIQHYMQEFAHEKHVDKAYESEHIQVSDEGQIVSYDDSYVSVGIVLRGLSYGSVFSYRKVWQQVGVYFLAWAFLNCLWLSVMLSTDLGDDFHPAQSKGLQTLDTLLMSFMPFFLASYLGTCFLRFWTIRTQGLGAIYNVINQLSLLMVTNLSKEQCQLQYDALVRYGTLLNSLLFLVLRGENKLDGLVADGLLTDAEHEVFKETTSPKPYQVWVWIADIWSDLYKQKHIEWFIYRESNELIHNGRSATKLIFTHVKVQIPFAWVHLIAYMVHICLMTNVFRTSAMTAYHGLRAYRDKGHGTHEGWLSGCSHQGAMVVCSSITIDAYLNILCCVLRLCIAAFLYMGFLEFTKRTHNPFGLYKVDFPKSTYIKALRSEQLDTFNMAGKGSTAKK